MNETGIKKALYQNRHTAIPYGIPALLAFVLYIGVVSNQLDRLEDLKFQVQDKTAYIAKNKNAANNASLYEKDIAQAKEMLGNMGSLLFAEGSGEELVSLALGLAKQNNISIEGMEAGKIEQGQFFNTLSLKLSVQGGFADLLGFFHALESNKPPVTISGLAMNADTRGVLKARFSIKAFAHNGQK